MLKELRELADEIAAQAIEEPGFPDYSHRKNEPRIQFIGTIDDDDLKRLHTTLNGEDHMDVIEHIGCFVDLGGPDDDPVEIPVDERRAIQLYGLRNGALDALFELALHKRFPELLNKRPEQHRWITKNWHVFLIEKATRKSKPITHS